VLSSPGEIPNLEAKYNFAEPEPDLGDSDEAILLALSE
jgi:hypothetical protein